MKHLIASACIMALCATQALANDVPYEPEPETPEGSGTDILPILLVFGAVLFAATRDRGGVSDTMNENRPLVRPQNCLDKFGHFVACE